MNIRKTTPYSAIHVPEPKFKMYRKLSVRKYTQFKGNVRNVKRKKKERKKERMWYKRQMHRQE